MTTLAVNPLLSFFSGFSIPGGVESPVITPALAKAVVAKLGEKPCTTLADVEKMIWNEHEPKNVKDGPSIPSEIKVHSFRAMKWTPVTGEEMRTLFLLRDKVLDDAPFELCPEKNPGVWMKLKMRQEFKVFEKKAA
jgi:hypothetical protein